MGLEGKVMMYISTMTEPQSGGVAIKGQRLSTLYRWHERAASPKIVQNNMTKEASSHGSIVGTLEGVEECNGDKVGIMEPGTRYSWVPWA
jgi:hypothetical protein